MRGLLRSIPDHLYRNLVVNYDGCAQAIPNDDRVSISQRGMNNWHEYSGRAHFHIFLPLIFRSRVGISIFIFPPPLGEIIGVTFSRFIVLDQNLFWRVSRREGSEKKKLSLSLTHFSGSTLRLIFCVRDGLCSLSLSLSLAAFFLDSVR